MSTGDVFFFFFFLHWPFAGNSHLRFKAVYSKQFTHFSPLSASRLSFASVLAFAASRREMRREEVAFLIRCTRFDHHTSARLDCSLRQANGRRPFICCSQLFVSSWLLQRDLVACCKLVQLSPLQLDSTQLCSIGQLPQRESESRSSYRRRRRRRPSRL